MAQDPHDEGYFGLFKPKTSPEPGDSNEAGSAEYDQHVDGETSPLEEKGWGSPPLEAEPLTVGPREPDRTLRMVGTFVAGGCLLLLLMAVVVFAFFKVFVRNGGDEEPRGTPSPTPHRVATSTPFSTAALTDSPLRVPLVSSNDVRVPIALPERLTVGEATFTVQAVEAALDAWPGAPAAGDTAVWIYGTVVNYIIGLAPTSGNPDLISALQVDDVLSLHMSTGLVLNFSVTGKAIAATDEAVFFDQVSPRLTLALLTDDPEQRTVVTAVFSDDEFAGAEAFSRAAVGLVGMQVDQGPVRVTVIETYQVAAGKAGLPLGTGYLLVDLSVENVGTTVLDPELFQTFVIDSEGKRYPLTMLAGQYAHYGLPVDPLAPGETVIGSIGYLIAGSPEGQMRWLFNPLPGSDQWVIVPVSYASLPLPPTAEPSPLVGFASVTVDSSNVFVNRNQGLLDIGLRIENISDGVVQVTEDDVGLSSWTDGELPLVASAPLLPWVIEPGERRLFQLQFKIPATDSALLDVLGYTFSIENLGGQ